MYKTILVPIDLSHPEPGKKILRLAQEISGSDSRIIMLNVLPEIPAFVEAEMPEAVLKRNLDNALSELQAFGEASGAEAAVKYGHAPTAILEHAEEVGADLIIIGSHRPGFQDYFLGSTAARVVRHARCAVLVDR